MTEGRIGAGGATVAFAIDDIRTGLRRLTPALLVLGLWLAFHPYTGIVHDSRLYVAQALNALHPDIFGQDLFFLYGSQDAFTLFTPLFAPLIAVLGPSAASLLAVAAGQALWLSGAAMLARRLLPEWTAVAAGLVLLAVLPAGYAGWQTFFFAEGFATPRLFAEALSLWALWALLDGTRRWGSGVCALLLLGAALLHPLIAAAGTAVAFVFLVLTDRRWAWLGAAGLAALPVVALVGVAPFDRLGQTMDPEWHAVVAARNIYLFPALWTAADWSRVVMAAATCTTASVLLQGASRRLLIAALVAGLAGLLVAHVGADWLRDLFVIQVQPYRTLWLLYVAAALGLGSLLVRLWRLEGDGRALVALLLFAWLTALAFHPPTGAAFTLAALGLCAARLTGRYGPLPRFAQHLAIAFAGSVVVFLLIYRIATLIQWAKITPDLEALIAVAAAPNVIEAAVATTFALSVWRFGPRRARRLLPAAALALAIFGAATWDRRGSWTETVAEAYPITAFERHLAPSAQVYWEGDARGAWLLLRRPSYVSAVQGAGIAFERRTALAFRDRARAVTPLTDGELINVFRAGKALAPPLPDLDRTMLADTCRADGALDALVLSRAVPGAWQAKWSPPAPVFDTGATRKGVSRPPIRTFYLYLCGELR